MNRRDFLKQTALGTAAGSLAVSARRDAIAAYETDQASQPATGPLRVHSKNPRYFADPQGRAVYLTGSHTWNSLVDMGPSDPPPAFDFDAYLDFLAQRDHNFIRLWTWELVSWNTKANGRHGHGEVHTVAPLAYARTGPGNALDGKPKFDLTKYNADYFDRLRRRVTAAGKLGIYVSVMLFEGWGIQFAEGAYRQHPFHPDNNVNGVAGDVNRDGRGVEVHELANEAITRLQEAYLRKVVDTMNDLDNVLYEVSNENHPASTEWQYHVIRYVRRYEEGKAKQHPIGMTFQYKGGTNEALFDGPADWISPNGAGGYRDDPPPADGRKVVLTDTDHLWGIGGNRAWVWKSFLRGHNPLFMDPYDGLILGNPFDPSWDPVRQSLSHTRRLARQMDLASMLPRPKLASSGYCLAKATAADAEYLVYLPSGGEATVDLSATSGKLSVEWINAATGASSSAAAISGGSKQNLTAPFPGEAVAWLRSTGGR